MSGKHATVLVVDNDPDYRTVLKELLEGLGCRILEASGPDDALQIVDTRPPRAIVMDMRLQDDDDPHDTSGIKLMRALPSHIPIIVLTAYQDAQVVRDAYEATPNAPRPWAYLFKGEGAEAIRARVLEALQANSSTARPWYQEPSFIVLAVLAAVLVIGGGLYIELANEGSRILGIIVVGVLIEVIAAVLLRFFKRDD